jgi:hypothetical protein
MAKKRTIDESVAPASGDVEDRKAKKQRKGFSVGPANLPDGTYKRKGM